MAQLSTRDGPYIDGPVHLIPLSVFEALIWVMATISILLTMGRLGLRYRNSRRLQLDDYLNATAAVLIVPFSIICHLMIPVQAQSQDFVLGLGPLPTASARQFGMNLELAEYFFFWMVIYLVKASFLALYWNIFAVSLRFRRIWWGTTIFTGLSYCTIFMSTFWRCGSPSKVANLDACSSTDDKILAGMLALWCALNVVGAILLMVLPLVMVFSHLLHLGKSQRIGLLFVFSLVLVDMAFDVVRTATALVPNLSNRTNINGIWTILEPTTAVMICALPHYKSALMCREKESRSTVNESYPGQGKKCVQRLKSYSSEIELRDTEVVQSPFVDKIATEAA